MITLFVVKSCADAKDPKRTIDSFGSMASEVRQVANLNEINSTDRVNDWYAIMHDNEWIDERLKEGLKVFIAQSNADVLVLYKKGDIASKAPRIYRRHITLSDNTLMPEQDVQFETVLNGWVHGIS